MIANLFSRSVPDHDSAEGTQGIAPHGVDYEEIFGRTAVLNLEHPA